MGTRRLRAARRAAQAAARLWGPRRRWQQWRQHHGRRQQRHRALLSAAPPSCSAVASGGSRARPASHTGDACRRPADSSDGGAPAGRQAAAAQCHIPPPRQPLGPRLPVCRHAAGHGRRGRLGQRCCHGCQILALHASLLWPAAQASTPACSPWRCCCSASRRALASGARRAAASRPPDTLRPNGAASLNTQPAAERGVGRGRGCRRRRGGGGGGGPGAAPGLGGAGPRRAPGQRSRLWLRVQLQGR